MKPQNLESPGQVHNMPALTKSSSSIASRLKPGAIPLLAFLLLAGMPLGRELTSSQLRYADQLAEETFQRASQLGVENTWVAAAALATIYTLAFAALFRERGDGMRRFWQLPALIASSSLCLVWTSFQLAALMNFVHLVGTTFVAVAASRAYSDEPETLVKYISYSLALNVAVHTFAAFLLPDIAINYDGRWAGLTTNPNSLGLIASLAIWSVITALFLKVLRLVAGVVLLLPSIIALYCSGSSTALVSTIIGVVLTFMLSQGKLNNIKLVSYMLIAQLCLLIGVLISSNVLGNFASIFSRDDTLTGRTFLWQEGIYLAAMKPVFGWGYDNHASLMLEAALPYGTFHNGYIDLAVRGGLVAILLMGGLVIAHLRRSMETSTYTGAIMLSYLVMFLAYNMTEVSIMSPRSPGWVLFLVTLFIAEKRDPIRLK